jgi:hypothetical protein
MTEPTDRGIALYEKARLICNEVLPCRAIVAGGLLRDIYLGVDPKDFDIFVGPDFLKFLENPRGVADINAALDKVADLVMVRTMSQELIRAGYFQGMQEDVIGLYSLEPVWRGFDDDQGFLDGGVGQIIVLDKEHTLESLVDRFDYDWCMFAVDGDTMGPVAGYGIELAYWGHRDAVYACDNKEVQFRPEAGNDREYSQVRAERWASSGKYHGFTFHGPIRTIESLG